MMILTAKLSKSKLITAAVVILAAIVCIVLLVSSSGGSEPAAADAHDPQAKTNEDRIAFLASYGWDVESEPVQTQEVRIPEEFNDVLTRYNEIQMEQGFDLSKLAGKQVKRYVYRVTNYPDTQNEVLATLIVYKNKVIGGDVSSSVQDGFIHGFEMPSAPNDTPDEAPQPRTESIPQTAQ